MKQEFKGDEALVVKIGGMRFVKCGQELWILEKHEWRSDDDREWYGDTPPGCYHDLRNPREIKNRGGNVYKVDIDGFEEIPVIPTHTMIRKIAKKLDLLEWTNAKLYALLDSARVELGCEELKNILLSRQFIQVIHSTNERSLYRFKWNDVIPEPLLKYEKEIKTVYERMCK